MRKRYNMHGCSGGGTNSLDLGYTGTATKSITNPFLGYTGNTMSGGTCNASAPSNAANFLGYQGQGQRGGGECAAMLGTESSQGQRGGMVPRLINADSFSNAPNLLAQNGGDGFPKPMPNATINLSDSGSVYTGSDPYLVTATKGGMAPDIAKAYPSTIGSPANVNWINNQTLHGGSCGCGTPLFGGRHRRRRSGQKGGRNYGDLVPNGLLGQPWTSAIGTWPGVDGVAMNRGHYELNTYANDVSRQTQAIGANFPFNGMPLKGGSRRRRSSTRRRHRYHRKHRMSYKQGCSRKRRGGAMSNFLSQDIINLGREFGFNANSAYNALNGTAAPVNPLPWKGQMTGSVLGK